MRGSLTFKIVQSNRHVNLDLEFTDPQQAQRFLELFNVFCIEEQAKGTFVNTIKKKGNIQMPDPGPAIGEPDDEV